MSRAAVGVARPGGPKTRGECGAIESGQRGRSSWTGREGEGARGQLRGQALPQQGWEVRECYVQLGCGAGPGWGAQEGSPGR